MYFNGCLARLFIHLLASEKLIGSKKQNVCEEGRGGFIHEIVNLVNCFPCTLITMKTRQEKVGCPECEHH